MNAESEREKERLISPSPPNGNVKIMEKEILIDSEMCAFRCACAFPQNHLSIYYIFASHLLHIHASAGRRNLVYFLALSNSLFLSRHLSVDLKSQKQMREKEELNLIFGWHFEQFNRFKNRFLLNGHGKSDFLHKILVNEREKSFFGVVLKFRSFKCLI